jgi:hypothetical protein
VFTAGKVGLKAAQKALQVALRPGVKHKVTRVPDQLPKAELTPAQAALLHQ